MRLGPATGGAHAIRLWVACLLVSFLLLGFSALTILSTGMLIAPSGIVLMSFSLVSLVADLRRRYKTR